MRQRSQAGFTVVEAMVVVAIIGILAAFAAPAMNQLIRTQKVRSAAYDIFSDLSFARSEAINRGHDIMMSSVQGTDWVGGWALRDLTTGEVIRQQGALSSGITFVGDAGSLTYDKNGRIQGTINVRFNIAPTESAPDNQKRCVRVSPSGRPNSLTGVCP